MTWMISRTLAWALGVAFLSALGCFARLVFGPDFGVGDTAVLGRALDVTHSPLAFIGGGALAMAVAESFFSRRVDAATGQPHPSPTSPERALFAAQALVVLLLLNCHRVAPAVVNVLS